MIYLGRFMEPTLLIGIKITLIRFNGISTTYIQCRFIKQLKRVVTSLTALFEK